MDGDPNAGAKPGVAFGPFRLSATQRLLTKEGVALQLSSRALDILIALIERPGEVVSKTDLISRAWPDLTVDESSLRVQVAGLRKILGDGKAGARYVANVPGRGYCFVAPVTRPDTPKTVLSEELTNSVQSTRLPPRLARMVGRDETVRSLSEQLAATRFVTIHGPGGIGKTTVAVAVAHAQLAAFKGEVLFLDLGARSDPRLVPSALAGALGLPVQSSDPTSTLVNFLRDRRMLLILDSCEHVIEAAAALAERIFLEASQISILTTSRETLRVEGEHVHQLSALDSPPEGVELTFAQILSFPAASLFVERAAASGHRLELSDADAPVVAEICRKLDGIALAIELAAGRVGAHGLHETAALLDNRLRLLWHGRRTALPRHQTLNATLDWSYDLIADLEQAVLRRLSVFVGAFSLQGAQAVAADEIVESAHVAEAMTQLVAKSLVSANDDGTTMRYRLLDTTRAYAHAKLTNSGEAEAVARRHAVHCQALLERTDRISPVENQSKRRAALAEDLGNIRAALEWSFSEGGDIGLGLELAASSARLFLDLSLLSECHCWTERALAALDETTRGSTCEMELQAGLGHSLMFTKGNSEQASAALTRGLELAEALEDRFSQFRLLSRLHIYHRRRGNISRLLPIAQRAEAVTAHIGDPVGIGAAHALLGASYHLVGNQVEARIHLEASLARPRASQDINSSHFFFQLPFPHDAMIALARTLWIQGFPDQAALAARQAAQEGAALRDIVMFCIPLIWGAPVFRWIGDRTTVEEHTERLLAHAAKHSLEPYLAVGDGLKGEVLIERGEIDRGIDLLRRSLASLRAQRYELYTPGLACTLAEGLALSGRLDQALATIDDTIALVERNGGAFNMPELLRIQGEILGRAADERRAESRLQQAIALSDQQSALSWRLRAAMSLARLHLRAGHRAQAREALAETYQRFHEGFDTADLKAAKLLLDEIGPAAA